MRKLVVVMGVPIDPLDMPETLDRIEQMVHVGRSTGKIHQVATVNADFVVNALFDPELRYLLQHADLLTADGMPLVWGARWQGVPLQGRVTGADLVPALAKRAAESGFSIYFLGGQPGVAARAARLLKEKYPELKISGVCSPPYSSILEMDTSFLDEIRQARPDILLVAFGNPKQEKWIGMYGPSLGVPVMIGVGGSLDFLTGVTRRAPEWMQQVGLEWLFRMLQEPKRLFKRYIIDLAIFGTFYLRQWLAMRLASGSDQRYTGAELKVIQRKAVIRLHGSLTQASLDSFDLVCEKALQASSQILVDLEHAQYVDNLATGALLELGNRARDAGGELSLAGVSPHIRMNLALLQLEDLFPIYPNVDTYLASGDSRRSGASPVIAGEIFCPTGRRNWTVLKTCRIVDASTAQELIEAGACALAVNTFLICDLSETVVLTSAGLAALSRLRKMAENLNGEFRVVNCSKDTLRVIKMARFDPVLPLYSDFSLAVR